MMVVSSYARGHVCLRLKTKRSTQITSQMDGQQKIIFIFIDLYVSIKYTHHLMATTTPKHNILNTLFNQYNMFIMRIVINYIWSQNMKYEQPVTRRNIEKILKNWKIKYIQPEQ